MKIARKPANERERLEALYNYSVLDTPPEKEYDDLVAIASQICGTPIAVISLVDEDRQWFKAKVGLNAAETSRDVAFCAHAIHESTPFIVEDATKDERFKDNPLVTSGPKIQFYTGTQLVTKDGHRLGTLCVIDQVPRKLNQGQIEALEALGRQVIALLELRRLNKLEEIQRKEIKIRKEKYELILNNLKEIIFQTDAQGVWTFLSPAWEETLGYSVAESVGNYFMDYVHPDDKVLNKTKFEPLIKREKEFCRHEVRYVKKDGSIAWIEVFARLTLGPNGEVLGTTGSLSDITAKKEAQKQLEEQSVQLLSTAKMSSLGEMAAGIAHEINNPLAIIRGNVQIIRRNLGAGSIEPSKLTKLIDKIEVTTTRISKIISGLRTFARDGNKDPFDYVSLSQIFDDTFELCKARFTSHKISLEVNIPNPQQTVYCQPTQICQVLLNLLNNAFDAAAEQEMKWVRVEAQAKGEYLEVLITDSGNGIPKSVQDKMMQPFYTTKPVGKGTGLGLSLSRGIVQSHNGDLIYVSESPNTQFKLVLPLEKKSSAAA